METPKRVVTDHYWSVSCVKTRCVLVSENSTSEFVFGICRVSTTFQPIPH